MIWKLLTHTLPDLPGPNSDIVYSLLDSADGSFSVDERTGVISLQRPLDRELQSAYELRAAAADRGSPRLSSLCQVLVSVLDINDNPPVFEHREYTASVSEDVSVGAQLLRVQAASRDSEANGEISYAIISGNEHGLFSVDPRTGRGGGLRGGGVSLCVWTECGNLNLVFAVFFVLRRRLCDPAAGLRGLSRVLHHRGGHGRGLAPPERHGHRQHQSDRRQRQPARLQPGRVHSRGQRGRRAGEDAGDGEDRRKSGGCSRSLLSSTLPLFYPTPST